MLYVAGMDAKQHIERAVAICGNSQTALAQRMGSSVRQGHIWRWLQAGRVTPKFAPLMEAAVGGQVRCEDLCPDVEWQRDHNGRVFAYRVRIEAQQSQQRAA